MDQNHIQCIMNSICNDLVDLDPFLKIAIPTKHTGNIIVEFFSAEMVVKVCKYLNCNAAGD